MTDPQTPIRFGLIAPPPGGPGREFVEAFTAWVTEHTPVALSAVLAEGYDALASQVKAGEVDAAWLPPIVFTQLAERVKALGAIERGKASTYEAALVVRDDAPAKTLEDLRGTRAGWVDPLSAAGFVLPRVTLAERGIDPRALFRTERFYGSHRAVVEALAAGQCDVVGTYAQTNDADGVTIGAWSALLGTTFRVLATFGAIPSDVIAVRSDLAEDAARATLAAMETAAADVRAAVALRGVFGGATFVPGTPPGYGTLEESLARAKTSGLFD